MITKNERLDILYYDGVSTYTDYSFDLKNFLLNTATITLATSEKIYIGYKKPISSLYVGLDTVNTNASVISIKYYNGSSFVAVSNLEDSTDGFLRSGWLEWDRNNNLEAETTVNSVEKYWYELTVSADTSAMVLNGVNMLFSDDLMIQELEPALVDADFYPDNESSFIGFHQSARNEIIQRMRNEGKGTFTLDQSDDDAISFNDLVVFDFHDYRQLSAAATYYAISQIYFERSDNVDDKYFQKYQDYKDRYNDAFRVYWLKVDRDDDGKEDDAENKGYQTRMITRV